MKMDGKESSKNIIEKTGEEDLVTINDPVDSGNEAEEVPPEIPFSPNISVTEKVIFCIDSLVLLNSVDGELSTNSIFNMLRAYYNMKRTISVKQVDFECILLLGKQMIHSPIHQIRDLHSALTAVKSGLPDETEPFDLSHLFTALAEMVEFPESNFHSGTLPPPCVYHAILLFGHNSHIPVLDFTNSFDFLMASPFFALDVLYIYDNTIDNNLCEQISQGMMCLNENKKGYFFIASKIEIPKQYSFMAQFLGHPLIRFPQTKAKYDIHELGPQEGDDDVEH